MWQIERTVCIMRTVHIYAWYSKGVNNNHKYTKLKCTFPAGQKAVGKKRLQ